jgi:hypothetical protein
VRRAVLTLAAGVCLVPPGAAAGADRVVTSGTVEDAHAGVILLSRGATGSRVRLLRHFRGSVAALPVSTFRTFGGPVRARLGHAKGGQLAAVWRRGRPSDVFSYGFTSRRERKVRSVSTRRGDEFSPALWRGRLGYARRGQGTFVGTRRIARTAGLPLALQGNVAALAYYVAPRDDEGDEEPYVGVRRIARGGRGRLCRVWSNPGDYFTVISVAVEGDYVFWAVDGIDSGDLLLRRRLPDGECRSRGPTEKLLEIDPPGLGDIGGFGVDGRRLFYSMDGTIYERERGTAP